MMSKITRLILLLSAALLAARPAAAQFGSLGKALSKASQTVGDLTFTDAEEAQLGADISAKLRQKYGVVQDPAVHRYVTLVGSVLAQASSRPNLKWTFIVLDTDGINAFAAPGGFVHITRGALALITNESELGCVLGHEISHVTQKHTIKAIQKSKAVSLGTQATRSDVIKQFGDQAYAAILENSYDRNDELDADKVGVTLANSVGYDPSGLAVFLTRLNDRNKNLTDRSGLFASHPETQARLDALAKLITGSKLAATGKVAARYASNVTYKPVPVDAVSQAGTTTAAAAPASGGSKLGLGSMGALGKENSSSQTISSAGSRGVNPDRDAKGGPNPGLVTVTVSAAEVADFRKGIGG
jgi:predicted Zn-dependent protease